jgi:salicylate biosynthesis isochorismate synthase/menaquinone-specific isochorismate synthase
VSLRTASREPFALDAEALERFAQSEKRALALARRDGRSAYATVTTAIDPGIDLSAAIFAARLSDERFFCLEQPDRGGFALASLGAVATLEARGNYRFRTLARASRDLGARVASGADVDPAAPPASGPVLVGGFAFAPDGGSAPEWRSLAPAQLLLPAIALARHRDEARLTVCALVAPDDAPGDALDRARRRLAALRLSPMPVLDPEPVARAQVAGAAPPSHYESAVLRAVERIRSGDLEKVVLAREVRVHAPAEPDPAAVFDALRAAFPACYCWCAGTPELAFVGASPELLVRREGARAQTVALAGTTRRSADPAVDDHLGERLLQSEKNREEQAIVARRIERTLAPVSLWVAGGDNPELVKVQNVQHLATAIRAQLAEPLAAIELAGLLHPTPAVCGEPRELAEPLIPALEGLDRGWYAGGVGWTDLAEDGEFCVALRCALLKGPVAHLYAGCGIVGDSQPAAELEETEVKLQALLPLLT